MSTSSSNDGRTPSEAHTQESRVSCVTCKKRKVRCDKQCPCANCARRHIDCVYQTLGKRRTRGPGKTRAGERIELMTGRLAQLEQELGKLQPQKQVEVSVEENHTSSPTSVSVGKATEMTSVHSPNDENEERNEARVLVKEGKSQYIRNNFWVAVNDELDRSGDSIDNHVSEISPPPKSSSNLLFGSFGAPSNLSMIRPPAFQIRLYWQIYIQNVDPVYKLIHKPSMESLITAATDCKTLSPGNEALLFGIYFIVTTSLSSAKFKSVFQDSREHLLARYRFGLESALQRAGLLSTQEMSTLQAFLLLIICIRRDDDARSVWALVGLATRLAIGMGLQHDGTKFNMTPLETELRRRLWWQLYLLEIRAAEDQGCEVTISEDSFDTRIPLNINDEDITADTIQAPPDRVGLTETTSCVMRLDIVATSRKIRTLDYGLIGNHHLSLREKLEAIKSCERVLHQKYLQFCRPDVPSAVFLYTLAKHCVAKMSLMAHQPNLRINDDNTPSTAEKPELSRDELFVMSITILEASKFLQSTPELEPWAWVARKYVQWHPLAYVLMELNSPSRQPGAVVDRAWRTIDNLFYRDKVEITADRSNESAGLPIEKLLAKARKRRADLTKIPEAHNVPSLVDLEQWTQLKFQDVGSTTENFDWFMGETETPMIGNGYVPQLTVPIQDVEFWDDMTGLFQSQPYDTNGAICGGEMSVDLW